MAKKLVMVSAMAIFVAASTACFGLFTRDDSPSAEQCDGLTGQAKVDCEKRKAAQGG